YAPWHDWENIAKNGPLAIIHAGILAANAHNTQPWRFTINADHIVLHADYARNLGSFDPYYRELTLSLGCALENMAHAAAAQGYVANVVTESGQLTLRNEAPATSPVARIYLEAGPKQCSPLYVAIGQRHTHRGRYETDKKIANDLVGEMLQLNSDASGVSLYIYDSGQQKNEIGELTIDATRQITADQTMSHDSARWFRLDRQSIDQFRDGVTIDAFALPAPINAIAKLAPTPNIKDGDKHWLQATRDVHVASASLFGVISVSDLYDRQLTLNAGRLWQRLHLWATTQHIAAQPLNQIPELIDREAQLGKPPNTQAHFSKITGHPTTRPTFIFRMGYAETAARLSPRRGIDSVID
ncbi:MAG: hypothetical protein ABW049_01870, partial [Spongiibacteraceae bacterium]